MPADELSGRADPAAREDAPSARLTAAQFAACTGVADWRVLWGGGYAAARFRTGSFAAGLALVAAIGELAVACRHDPDVDPRPESVAVRLQTAGVEGLTRRDAGRHRLPLDIYVPHDQVRARIDAALAAGGRMVSDAHAPGWWTLADPEGNEADLAIWG